MLAAASTHVPRNLTLEVVVVTLGALRCSAGGFETWHGPGAEAAPGAVATVSIGDTAVSQPLHVLPESSG